MIEFEKVITNCIPTAKESQKKLSTDLLNNHFSSAITMAEQL
jgi:CRISPR/Cas system CMR subunit Cmr6 (Cas7 group RAMP superfamily)